MVKILALLAGLLVGLAHAAPYELRMSQRDAADAATWNRSMPPLSPVPGTSAVIVYDGNTALPMQGAIGSGLAWNGSTLSVSLPSVGTAGTYNTVTTDAQGRVTAGFALSINDAPGRSIVTSTSSTGFQISSTRAASVCYEGTFSTTTTIGGPASITVFLETADTNSTTPGDWTVKARQTNSNTLTVAVALQQQDVEPWSICRWIPAAKFVRIRSGNVTGTATAAINTEQQEVLQ